MENGFSKRIYIPLFLGSSILFIPQFENSTKKLFLFYVYKKSLPCTNVIKLVFARLIPYILIINIKSKPQAI